MEVVPWPKCGPEEAPVEGQRYHRWERRASVWRDGPPGPGVRSAAGRDIVGQVGTEAAARRKDYWDRGQEKLIDRELVELEGRRAGVY
jgi:hypothetical protein